LIRVECRVRRGNVGSLAEHIAEERNRLPVELGGALDNVERHAEVVAEHGGSPPSALAPQVRYSPTIIRTGLQAAGEADA
jgi:hypothetical protein